MHMKEFFDGLAEELSARPLPDFGSVDELSHWQEKRRAQLRRAWGIPEPGEDGRREPPVMTLTGVVEEDDYRIERVYFESLDHLVVTANIYVPNGLVAPAPAILYLCGHAPTQKIRYQEHGRRFTQLGFVTMIVDTIQYGEIPGVHHGLWDQGRFQWVSRGYSPVAVEAWNAQRAIDLLCARPDVDQGRIGVTGISGGGAVTWWVAALDDRVKAIASSSGTGAERSHLVDHTLDVHCDCFFPNNPQGRPLLETYLLAAPKPVLIVGAKHDHVFTTASVEHVHDRLRRVYDQVGDPGDLRLLFTDSEHQYTETSRRAIFAWMLTHVAGVPALPDETPDIDGVTHPDTLLEVLPERAGPDPLETRPDEIARFRTARVDEWFVPSDRRTRSDSELAVAIRADCLGFFPADPPDLAVRADHAFQRDGRVIMEFSFDSESPWRLRGQLRSGPGGEFRGPVVVVLRSPEDGSRVAAHGLAATRRPDGPHAVVDVRGSGDTAWHPSLNWHLRRAARVLGRTIAGMQVFDALRAVQAVRELSDGSEIELAAEGDLAAVAIVCGILDPAISVVVRDAPATFDAPSSPTGTDRVIEMTNILRYTDLPDLRRRLEESGRLATLSAWERER